MPNAYGQGWTKARVEDLKTMYAEGLSCSIIGARMGVTRNAIIGKVHRLGIGAGHGRQHSLRNIPKRRDGVNVPGSGWRRRQRSASAAQDAILRAQKAQAVLEAAVRLVNQAGPDLKIAPADRLRLDQLPDGNCRWPFGDGPFYFHRCAAEPGLPYCDFHRKRAFAPAQPSSPPRPAFDISVRPARVAEGRAANLRVLSKFEIA